LGKNIANVNRGDHSGRFEGVLKAVSPSVLVVRTFPKWTENDFNREHSFVKMISMEF
jgi:hypothetical protein